MLEKLEIHDMSSVLVNSLEIPNQVADLMDEFIDADGDTGYLYEGDVYNPSINALSIQIDFELIIKQHLSQRENVAHPLHVLDIGTGYGMLPEKLNDIYYNKVNAIGITAHNIRKNNIPSYIILANAERLLSIDGIRSNQFDLIVSKMTFMHLKNRAKVLIDAYDALKVGGLLIIDFLSFEGLSPKQHEQLVEHLQKQGYDITALLFQEEENSYALSPIVLKKSANKPYLELPLQYDLEATSTMGDEVYYQLALPEINKCIEPIDSPISIYTQLKKTLLDLFHDTHYSSLNWLEQYKVFIKLINTFDLSNIESYVLEIIQRSPEITRCILNSIDSNNYDWLMIGMFLYECSQQKHLLENPIQDEDLWLSAMIFIASRTIARDTIIDKFKGKLDEMGVKYYDNPDLKLQNTLYTECNLKLMPLSGWLTNRSIPQADDNICHESYSPKFFNYDNKDQYVDEKNNFSVLKSEKQFEPEQVLNNPLGM